MNVQKTGSKKAGYKTTVPVKVEGVTMRMDLSQISIDDVTIHHGQTANGKKVNSPASIAKGDSLIIWPSGYGGPAFSINNDDFEVLAIQRLKTMGFKVTAGPDLALAGAAQA